MKSYDEKNLEVWSQVINENVMLYPNEKVVAFLARNFKKRELNQELKALDIGFGSGRHIKLLLDYGFNVSGIDYSNDSVKTAKKLLGEDLDLTLKSLDEIDDVVTYDVILAYGVIFFRPLEQMKQDLIKLNTILEHNGKILLNFRTKEDYLYGMGERLSNESYILNNETEYDGVLYTFLNKEEAIELVESAGFKILNIEREDYWKNNLTEHHSWWIISAEKVKSL